MYIATTLIGLEDIASKDLKGEIIFPARIKFGKSSKFGSVINVYELIYEFTFNNLPEILDKIKGLELKGSFKVICERTGSHDFNSFDVVIKASALLKQKYKQDFKKPKNKIFIDIINNTCLIGILKKENLHKRKYRIKINNQSVFPPIAYAMLKLADCRKDSFVLDPFCRDSMMPIEAAKLKAKVYATDNNKNNIRNSSINIRMSEQEITLECLPIENLDKRFKEKFFDIICTSPPSPSSRKPKADKIVGIFIEKSYNLLKDSGILILLTQKKDFIIELVNNKFKLDKELIVMLGEEKYYILKFKKV